MSHREGPGRSEPDPPVVVSAILGPHPGSRAPERTRLGPHTERWTGPDGSVIRRDPGSLRKSQQEATALQALAGIVGVPRLLAQEGGLIWQTACPGTPAVTSSAALRALGKLLAQIRDRPTPSDPLDLSQALQQRWEALKKGSTVVEYRELPPPDFACFRGQTRVWSHRDLAPRNWTWVAEPAQIFLLDWEHARPDAPAADLARLRLELGFGTDLSPLYEGLGESPDPLALRALSYWQALATLAWGRDHADPHFIRRGTHWLAGLRQEDQLSWRG